MRAFCNAICIQPQVIEGFERFGIGSAFAPDARMAKSTQRIVYVLRNTELPPRYYTGLTSDLAARIVVHNKGGCPHTAKYRPWNVDVIVKFADEARALKFEKYLKSGSGVEFARRHLR